MSISSQLAASRLIQPGVIPNAASRPASPFQGQCIYQTDTNQLLVWNGTAWVIPNQTTTNPDGLELVKAQAFSGGSVNITSCFSADYLNYKIVIDISSGGNGYLRLQMCSGTTPNTSGYSGVGAFSYLSAGSQFNDNVGTGNQAVSSAVVGVIGSAGGVGGTSIEMFAPFDSRATTGMFIGGGNITNTGMQYATGGFIHYNGGSFNGFTLLSPGGATMTGTARVYGYRNS